MNRQQIIIICVLSIVLAISGLSAILLRKQPIQPTIWTEIRSAHAHYYLTDEANPTLPKETCSVFYGEHGVYAVPTDQPNAAQILVTLIFVDQGVIVPEHQNYIPPTQTKPKYKL